MFLAHHGVVAVGKSPLDAYSKVQSAEGLIKTYFIRSLLFGQRDCSLPADEIARLLRMHEGR
jgi:L-fuculose-phosphate aldolase